MPPEDAPMQLDPAAVGAGVQLAAFAALGSTNEEALARARRGAFGPLWVVAREQTAGRGRRGRSWVSEPGNLYATLLVTDPSRPERAAELSFVAALAVHDALVELAPGLAPRLALKWPNDLLCDGRKLAGILIEGENIGDRLAAAVGIGINCVSHPVGTTYPAADLSAAGFPLAPEDLLRILSRTMLERLAQWRRGSGFAAIRENWLARGAGLGCPIEVLQGEERLSGRFDGLDETGRLIMHLPDGTRRVIAAGDVSLSWPAPAEVPSA